MSYTDTLNSSQKEIIELIIQNLNEKGITNKFTQSGIMAVISKESNFIPKSELSYRNTSNDRIRKVFKTKLGHKSDAELDILKADDEAFFNAVYGGIYGSAPNEGYKYRGRGLNGITFKANYQRFSAYTEYDIVGNPDLLNKPQVAVDVMVGYFIECLKLVMHQYGMKSLNDAKTLEDAVGAAYHANAGVGLSKEDVKNDSTGGRKRSFERMADLYLYNKSVDPHSNWEEPEGYEVPTDYVYSDDIQPSDPTTIGTSISASVGKGGTNRRSDVRVVQKLLNDNNSAGLTVDGLIGSATIAAIKTFQQKTFGWADGRIDVGGKSWGALSDGAILDDQNQDDTVETNVNPIPLDANVYPCFN